MGNSAASLSSNRNTPVRSYTSQKTQVPTQAEYVPKSTFTQAKPSKVSTPAAVKPAQVQIPIVSQQPQTKHSYRNVAPGEESYSTFDVQPGSKLAIGDQTYVVVPAGDYDGNKESIYTHSLVGNDKSSISEGSFFPYPSDTYTQDKPTAFKYPLASPAVYTSSENAAPDVSYVYNLEQPAGISAGSYGSGYTQGRPSLFYGADLSSDNAPAANYGPESSDDGVSATLYSSDNNQPISDQGSSSYAGDETSAGNYGSDYSEDKGDAAVSYGSDYSGGIGSMDSHGSAQSGIKTNQKSYGSN